MSPTAKFTAFQGALCAALLASISLAFAGEHGTSREAYGRPWLSIGEVSQRLEAAGYRNIEKIEREHGQYEARATDRQGVRTKLFINPETGAIRAREGSRRDREVALADQRPDGGNPANCSKRRCRDDLPATVIPTPANNRN